MRALVLLGLITTSSGCAVLRGSPLDPKQTKLNGARQMIKEEKCREALPVLEEIQAERSSESIQQDIEHCKVQVAALEAKEKQEIEFRMSRSLKNLNALNPGDPKAPIVRALGEPEKREIVDGAEILHYFIWEKDRWAPYQIKFKDNKLVGYHRDQELLDKLQAQADRQRVIAAQEEQVRIQEQSRRDAAWQNFSNGLQQQNQQIQQHQHEMRMRQMEMYQPRNVNCTSNQYGNTTYTNCR